MFFGPAILATLKLKEASNHEDKPSRVLALVSVKEKGKAERSSKRRNAVFTFKRQT
jgi:hypothetical protein